MRSPAQVHVILGRALGHQCRHPPMLDHEQLHISNPSVRKLVIPRWYPDGGETWFWSCRWPAAQLGRGKQIPSQEPTPFLPRLAQLPLHSQFPCSVSSPDFGCGHRHRNHIVAAECPWRRRRRQLLHLMCINFTLHTGRFHLPILLGVKAALSPSVKCPLSTNVLICFNDSHYACVS